MTKKEQKRHKECPEKDFVQATEEGKLYIDSSDFFQLQEVQDTIFKFLKSDMFKSIEEKKHIREEKTA